MKRLFVLVALMFANLTHAQSVPWDSAVLTWTKPTVYANGGSLPDPISLSYIIEASAPCGNGFGPLVVVRDVLEYRFDGLCPGIWSFRIKVLNGYNFGAASLVVTKTIVEPAKTTPVALGVAIK